MKSKLSPYFWYFAGLLTGIILFLIIFSLKPANSWDSLVTNNEFIDDLYTSDLNWSNTKDVFRFVFSDLDDEVTVYPTENYYYFTFARDGKVIGGAMGLFVNERENNTFGFSFYEKKEDPDWYPAFENETNGVGGAAFYGANESVFVKKLAEDKYSVTFESKTVLFKLNDVGMSPPKNAKLLPEETFVGPIFDESGLKLFILFNHATNYLYFILNEDGFVPESFDSFGEDLLVGRRTSFMFFNDSINNRKILVGVQGKNVLKNNWYDGPFDQMPDNYIALGLIPDYQYFLEAAFPGTKGRIDKFGRYNETSRVAVSPYRVYFTYPEIAGYISECKEFTSSLSELYSCMTQSYYEIPDGFYVAKI